MAYWMIRLGFGKLDPREIQELFISVPINKMFITELDKI